MTLICPFHYLASSIGILCLCLSAKSVLLRRIATTSTRPTKQCACLHRFLCIAFQTSNRRMNRAMCLIMCFAMRLQVSISWIATCNRANRCLLTMWRCNLGCNAKFRLNLLRHLSQSPRCHYDCPKEHCRT